MLNTSLWGLRVWHPTCWRDKGNKGISVSWGKPEKYQHQAHAYTHTPFHQMTHCHSVCLSWPTTYPLQVPKEQVWVHTFGAILDSPFAWAFVLSPFSPPFPPAHCELQRMKGWSVNLWIQASVQWGSLWNKYKRAACLKCLICSTLNWISPLKLKKLPSLAVLCF